MDPLTAFANVVTAVTNLVQTIAEGQPPEVRKQLWDWYVADVAAFRKLFKVDE
jgi:hypothetical protein